MILRLSIIPITHTSLRVRISMPGEKFYDAEQYERDTAKLAEIYKFKQVTEYVQ